MDASTWKRSYGITQLGVKYLESQSVVELKIPLEWEIQRLHGQKVHSLSQCLCCFLFNLLVLLVLQPVFLLPTSPSSGSTEQCALSLFCTCPNSLSLASVTLCPSCSTGAPSHFCILPSCFGFLDLKCARYYFLMPFPDSFAQSLSHFFYIFL